jgi:asparagine synthase (glutamine-hydrolysing)
MCGICGIITKNVCEDLTYHNIFTTRAKTIKYRGPDRSNYLSIKKDSNIIKCCFHRLCIVGPDPFGDQPFIKDNVFVFCNGEIYNYKELIALFDIKCKSESDCEVILHLYLNIGFYNMIHRLRGEFAIVIIDLKSKLIYMSRDPFGIRPLFSYTNKNTIIFASEGKFDSRLVQITPATVYRITLLDSGYITDERTYYMFPAISIIKMNHDVYNTIQKTFVNAVYKRLHADRNIGFFLSGGLDSSLVLSIAMTSKLKYPVNVFSIGLSDSTDITRAKIVVDYLKSKYGSESINHHIITYTVEEGISKIPQVIYHLESYDQTTVRASTPMFILSEYISTHTDVRVLLSGEGADELLGGYLYFSYAPTAKEFDKECKKRLSKLYLYDNLRADRTTAAFGLELRLPFLDQDYVDIILSLYYGIRMPNNKQIEKFLMRHTFEGYLPHEILWAQKQAFSDGVGYSWKNSIKLWATDLIKTSDKYNQEYEINPPNTPEEKVYRYIFEQYYSNRGHLIPEMWLPNQEWINTNGESSATVLNVHHNNILSKL